MNAKHKRLAELERQRPQHDGSRKYEIIIKAIELEGSTDLDAAEKLAALNAELEEIAAIEAQQPKTAKEQHYDAIIAEIEATA